MVAADPVRYDRDNSRYVRVNQSKLPSRDREAGHPGLKPRRKKRASMASLIDEKDYEARYDTDVQGIFLAGTNIEIIREPPGRGGFKHALFDFDGTLSLIREGWPDIMAGMMLDVLSAVPKREPDVEMRARVHDFILRTMGMQTIYQMIGLAQEVERCGGIPLDPADYKKRYVGLLMDHIRARLESLRLGEADPQKLLVPGAREFLRRLKFIGIELCLASGTDEDFVKEEAELLGVAEFFGSRIYGAVADFRAFSKAMVIERILCENAIDGRHLLGFGDGYVEIDNTKCAGGTGIGVATDESDMTGRPNPLKRARLLGVGADIVVPDFRHGDALVGYLMGEA